MQIRLIVTGRNYDRATVPGHLELPDGGMLSDALAKLTNHFHADNPIPPSGLLAVNRRHVGTVAAPVDCPLADADELMVIFPVAGG
jgi:hypothetical protein